MDLAPAGRDALLRGLAVTPGGGLVTAWSTTPDCGSPAGEVAIDPDGRRSPDA